MPVLCGHTSSPYITAYHWDDATGWGSKYSAPGSTPPAVCYTYGYSGDNDSGDAVVAHQNSPYVSAYPWSTIDGWGTKYSDPATTPGANCWTCDMHPDGDAIVLASGSSPYVHAYAWSSGFGSKYSNPASGPNNWQWAAAFSGPGTDVACGGQSLLSGPNLYGWPWSSASGFGTKYTSPSQYGGQITELSFNLMDYSISAAHLGAFGALPISAHAFTPGVGFGSRYSDPASYDTGLCEAVSFAFGGDDVGVGGSTYPYQNFWTWSSGFGSKYAQPATLTGMVEDMCWSSNDNLVFFADTSTAKVGAYPWTSGLGTKYSNPASSLPSTGRGVYILPEALELTYGFRWSPGCQCCPETGCDIYNDNFNRTDSTSLGSGWTEVTGDWEIYNEVLRTGVLGTGSPSNAIALCAAPHPDSEARQIVEVDLKGYDSGDKGGVVVDYVDELNYHYVEVEFYDSPASTGYLRFFKVTDGVFDQLGEDREVDAQADSWYHLKVCFVGEEPGTGSGTGTGTGVSEYSVVMAQFESEQLQAQITDQHAGYYAGLAVEAVTDAFEFDDFDYNKHYSFTNPLCERCSGVQPCENCLNGAPRYLIIEFTGWTNSCESGDCSNANQSTVLTNYGWLTYNPAYDCYYAYIWPEADRSCDCNEALAYQEQVNVTISSLGGGQYQVYITRIFCSDLVDATYIFKKTYDSLVDCSNLFEEEIPYDSCTYRQWNGSGSIISSGACAGLEPCDPSAVVCRLTAI